MTIHCRLLDIYQWSKDMQLSLGIYTTDMWHSYDIWRSREIAHSELISKMLTTIKVCGCNKYIEENKDTPKKALSVISLIPWSSEKTCCTELSFITHVLVFTAMNVLYSAHIITTILKVPRVNTNNLARHITLKLFEICYPLCGNLLKSLHKSSNCGGTLSSSFQQNGITIKLLKLTNFRDNMDMIFYTYANLHSESFYCL